MVSRGRALRLTSPVHGIQFEQDSGALRITREDFAVLAAFARAGPAGADPNAAARLRAAGALTDRGVHPALDGVLAAVNQPVCEIRLDRRDASDRERRAVGWVDPWVVALLTDRQRDPRWDLDTTHP